MLARSLLVTRLLVTVDSKMFYIGKLRSSIKIINVCRRTFPIGMEQVVVEVRF